MVPWKEPQVVVTVAVNWTVCPVCGEALAGLTETLNTFSETTIVATADFVGSATLVAIA
jgi:hypothetical protein